MRQYCLVGAACVLLSLSAVQGAAGADKEARPGPTASHPAVPNAPIQNPPNLQPPLNANGHPFGAPVKPGIETNVTGDNRPDQWRY